MTPPTEQTNQKSVEASARQRLNLARKYRPTSLEAVLGQSHATKILTEAIRSNKIAPAYLFSGPRGIGKTSTARIFAKAASCLSEDFSQRPCGSCKACEAFQTGRLMDVLEIDGASHTGVDDIRKIIDAVAYKPSVGRRNVFIIDEVHMLSNAAFNALLKTLEEPPSHALFIFATTEVEKLPATVLSRVQRLELRRLTESEIKKSLLQICSIEKVTAEEASLMQISAAADGSMRDAQTLLEQLLLLSDENNKLQHSVVDTFLGTIGTDKEIIFLKNISKRDTQALLKQIHEFFSQGKDLSKLSERLLTWMRHLLVYKACGKSMFSEEDLSSEYLESAAEGFAEWSEEDLDRLFEIFLEANQQMRQTGFPKILLETTVLRAARIPSTQDLARLLASVEKNASNFSASPQPESSRPAPRAKGRAAPIAQSNPAPTPSKTASTSEEMLSEFAKKRPSLASLVKCAERFSWEDSRVQIEFPHGHFAYKQLSEPLMKQELLKGFESIAQKTLELALIEGGSSSSEPKKAERRTDFIKEAKEQVLTHPEVKRATELLKGKVSSVTIEGIKT